MRNLKSLTLSWCSFSRQGREPVASSFAFKGGQYLSYAYLQPIATQITQDAMAKILDAPLTLFSRMGQGACLSIFWSECGQYIQQEQRRTMVNILWLTVGYLKSTMNRETWNAAPEIVLDRSSQAQRYPGLTGPGPSLDLHKQVGAVFGLDWNQTTPFCQFEPGPMAGYTDPLLSLLSV